MALKSERRFISKNDIQSGILIEFFYKKKDGSTKKYITLVIDPDKNGLLHALLIDDLSDFEILQTITKLANLNYDPSNPKAPITNLQTDEAYVNYSLIKDQRRYRTFLTENIFNLRQILIGDVS
jgi:hypothetical protein